MAAQGMVERAHARVGGPSRRLRRSPEIIALMRALLRDSPLPPSADAPPVSGAEHSAVYAAVAKLEAPLRDALVTVDVAELSYAEAAKVLRASPSRVAARVFRAREELVRRSEGSP